jgi:hypothetical protein
MNGVAGQATFSEARVATYEVAEVSGDDVTQLKVTFTSASTVTGDGADQSTAGLAGKSFVAIIPDKWSINANITNEGGNAPSPGENAAVNDTVTGRGRPEQLAEVPATPMSVGDHDEPLANVLAFVAQDDAVKPVVSGASVTLSQIADDVGVFAVTATVTSDQTDVGGAKRVTNWTGTIRVASNARILGIDVSGKATSNGPSGPSNGDVKISITYSPPA